MAYVVKQTHTTRKPLIMADNDGRSENGASYVLLVVDICKVTVAVSMGRIYKQNTRINQQADKIEYEFKNTMQPS